MLKRDFMDPSLACEAISKGCRLEVRYDGFTRVVEVHAVGTSKSGNAIMRVWQVRGGSASGSQTGWKIFRLDEIVGAELSDEPSTAPQPGYKRGDSAMARVICEV